MSVFCWPLLTSNNFASFLSTSIISEIMRPCKCWEVLWVLQKCNSPLCQTIGLLSMVFHALHCPWHLWEIALILYLVSHLISTNFYTSQLLPIRRQLPNSKDIFHLKGESFIFLNCCLGNILGRHNYLEESTILPPPHAWHSWLASSVAVIIGKKECHPSHPALRALLDLAMASSEFKLLIPWWREKCFFFLTWKPFLCFRLAFG